MVVVSSATFHPNNKVSGNRLSQVHLEPMHVALHFSMPVGVPEGTEIAIDQILNVLAFLRIAKRARQLIRTGNQGVSIILWLCPNG